MNITPSVDPNPALRTVLRDPINSLSDESPWPGLPRWAQNDPRQHALTDDIQARGIDYPLLITHKGFVVDGVKRLWAARALQLPEIKCRIIEDSEVISTILANLLHRSHYTKGQLAYLSYPMLAPAWEESKRRRMLNLDKNLQKGQCSPESTFNVLSGKTVGDFAEKIGIHRNTFLQAAAIHKHFTSPKKYEWNDEHSELTMREYFEPRILHAEDPAGLGAVIAGIQAKLSGKTLDQAQSTQLDLFTDGLCALQKRFGYWPSFDKAAREKARLEIKETVARMPDDLREEWSAAIKEAAKARSTNATNATTH
jgi:hypothetical protein